MKGRRLGYPADGYNPNVYSRKVNIHARDVERDIASQHSMVTIPSPTGG